MGIPFFLALLLATTTNADDDLKNIGSAAGGALGGVLGATVVGAASAGGAATVAGALGPAVGIAVGAAVGGALVREGVDSGIKWAQDKHIIDYVPDKNIPILQEPKSMVEPWLAAIRSQIQGLDQTMREQHHLFADFVIESVTDYMEKYSPIIAKMQDIDKIINKISFRYQRMLTYKSRNTFEKMTLINYAEDTLSILQDSLNELHVTLLGDEDRPHVTPNNVLVQLDTRLKRSSSHMCRTRQSAQQFFYLLQEDVALTELKALALADYSWTLLKEEGEFSEEKRLMLEEYQRRTNRTLRMFKEVMSRQDRTVWRCDPAYHRSGVTYEEVTRLLQGYIENEADLNADRSCKQECSTYQHSKTQGCYDGELCKKQQPCKGNVHNCRYVESTMTVCLTDETAIRRYEYVEYKSGHRYGQGGKCGGHTDKAESWHRWIFWHCSYCMCLCDEQGLRSDRYFNLRPVTADVERNRVVTGLRFVKHNRILHLQIQEGELLPKGVINQTTLQWKPVDNYSITDKDVRQVGTT
ncbi:uncharacterized protein [Drosophila kikkawai]|uniref:Uncharacterized protein n=1 Tax=Drosophila kikkawai TaxID=30033 RepID=A0ABM4GAB9_DROKI